MEERMFNKKTIFSIMVFMISVAPMAKAKTDPVAYILIDNVSQNFEGNLSCELAVMMSTDHREVRVARLDHRKGMYSVNYFAKSTALFGNFGIKFDIDDEFNLKSAPITKVQASFKFKDSHHDLILKATLTDPMTGVEDIKEKTISLDQEFFNDHPRKCLK